MVYCFCSCGRFLSLVGKRGETAKSQSLICPPTNLFLSLMDDLNIITLKSVFYHLCANQYFKVSNYYPKYEGQTGVVIEIINDKFYLERSDYWVSCKVRLESGEIAEFYDCCLYFADPTKDYVCKIVKWENIRRHR